jgi:hypothetical protein
MDDGVLWKGALAIGGGRAAVLAIVTRAFNNDHPNYVCPSISGLACTLYIVNFTWQLDSVIPNHPCPPQFELHSSYPPSPNYMCIYLLL